MTKKILAILAALCLVAAMGSVGASAAVMKNDAEFNILVIPDAHQNADEDLNLTAYITSAINYSNAQTNKLDLVIFLGDNTAGSGCKSIDALKTSIARILAPVQAANIPFTLVFGNHDYGDIPEDVKAGFTKANLLQLYKDADTSGLFLTPDAEFASEKGGVTNFKYSIYNSDETPFANIFLFDTGSKEAGQDGYDYVRKDQLDWFKSVNDASIPALVFQHIALPQVYEGFFIKSPFNWKLPGTKNILGKNYFGIPNNVNMVGTALEAPCPPNYEDAELGEWAAITESGNVKAAFFGHDHVNNYIEKFPDQKIDLVQLPGTAWNGSYGTYLVRGGSFVTLRTVNGQVSYTHDFFTYRQASRVAGSGVLSTVKGFDDLIYTVPFLFQNLFIDLFAPIRWLGGSF